MIFNKVCGDTGDVCVEGAGWFAKIQVYVRTGTCQE
jgi:hypothetical protein